MFYLVMYSMRFHYGDQSGGWWRKPAASPLHGEPVAVSSKGSVYGPIYLVRTPNSRSVFRAGVSLNNHSFIHVYGSSHKQSSACCSHSYTRCGALAGTRNSFLGPPRGFDLMIPHIVSGRSTTELHFAPMYRRSVYLN